ncbi:HNH endonuclease signature motif containing protein [Shewanella surugensis]|uniref:HNH endonuclease n=1 Tax=Shewanella surugensis TaxID=212020 RepID=A0ABT0LJ06_9GAMM|nr:HNH endonuclease signature motif containing protein [Shewanella surugensis]MCL1127673.1 HNH endonuclease [Shewanella surugensis]
MNLPKYAQEELNKGNSVDRFFCVNCNLGRYFGGSDDEYKCLKCGSSEKLEVSRSLNSKEKDQIRESSGGKCANPGCSAWRTHIHHIDEWAIFHSDDPEILIPVCPSCHDQIHHGVIPISRETLIQWKNIIRKRSIRNLHIYVEPGENLKFCAGGLWLASPPNKMGLHLFEFAPNVKVKFNIQGNKISLVDISICDINGNLAVEVLSNYIEVIDPDLICEKRNGHVKIFTNDVEKYLPLALVAKMKEKENGFANETITVLEIEVLRPGEVVLKGCWYDDGQAVLMTEGGLTFVPQMSSLVSDNPECTLTYTGDVPFFSRKPHEIKIKKRTE